MNRHWPFSNAAFYVHGISHFSFGSYNNDNLLWLPIDLSVYNLSAWSTLIYDEIFDYSYQTSERGTIEVDG